MLESQPCWECLHTEHWITVEGSPGSALNILHCEYRWNESPVNKILIHKLYFVRQKLFRHKHEAESGRTSSVGNDILGFDSSGQV